MYKNNESLKTDCFLKTLEKRLVSKSGSGGEAVCCHILKKKQELNLNFFYLPQNVWQLSSGCCDHTLGTDSDI